MQEIGVLGLGILQTRKARHLQIPKELSIQTMKQAVV